MARTRIKFCGVTRPQDAHHAAQLGVDAIGMVYVHASPRCIPCATGAEIARSLPAFVSRVALFADPSAEWVRHVLAQVEVDCLQFHGAEPASFCRSFGKPYLKAIPMNPAPARWPAVCDDYPDARALVLDGHTPGGQGGGGIVFDWRAAAPCAPRPVLLAGGLHADNVAQAIAQARPWGVDVSSGIEHAPGVKDARKMADFVQEVQRADRA